MNSKIGASSLSQSLTNLARARFTITLTHRFGFRQAVAANSRALEAMSDTPVRERAQRPATSICNAFCVWQTSLDQVCSKREGSEQPFAFKDLMIHLILQFTLHIAFRGVLHRCENPEIHR